MFSNTVKIQEAVRKNEIIDRMPWGLDWDLLTLNQKADFCYLRGHHILCDANRDIVIKDYNYLSKIAEERGADKLYMYL